MSLTIVILFTKRTTPGLSRDGCECFHSLQLWLAQEKKACEWRPMWRIYAENIPHIGIVCVALDPLWSLRSHGLARKGRAFGSATWPFFWDRMDQSWVWEPVLSSRKTIMFPFPSDGKNGEKKHKEDCDSKVEYLLDMSMALTHSDGNLYSYCFPPHEAVGGMLLLLLLLKMNMNSTNMLTNMLCKVLPDHFSNFWPHVVQRHLSNLPAFET